MAVFVVRRGGSGGQSDSAALSKTISVATAVTTGSYLLVSKQELVDAGILESTADSIGDLWNHYSISVEAGGVTHRTGGLVASKAYNPPMQYRASNLYHQTQWLHEGGATNVTMYNNQSDIFSGSSLRGFLTEMDSGIVIGCYTSLVLMVGTYNVTVFVSGRK